MSILPVYVGIPVPGVSLASSFNMKVRDSVIFTFYSRITNFFFMNFIAADPNRPIAGLLRNIYLFNF